jgi:hypothetical protein
VSVSRWSLRCRRRGSFIPASGNPTSEPFERFAVGPQRPGHRVHHCTVQCADQPADLPVEHGAVQFGAHHQRVRGSDAGGDHQIEIGGELRAGMRGKERHRTWSGCGDEPDQADRGMVEDADLPAGHFGLHAGSKDGSTRACQPWFGWRNGQRNRFLSGWLPVRVRPRTPTRPADDCAGGRAVSVL